MSGECEDCGEHALDCQCPRCYIEFSKKDPSCITILRQDHTCDALRYAGSCLSPHDPINHPSHYKGDRFEVIDIIEDFKLDFQLGNAIKYILRAGKKGNRIEDLKKAIWYINREIENEK